MATSQMRKVLQHLRRAARAPDDISMTDGHLLDLFINGRDETAFATLVRRHGPLVWGVCRRILAGHQDAEDAFQATFLVLVRKAAAISSRELLANWLYGVAYRTSVKARAEAIKRTQKEKQVANKFQVKSEKEDRELQAALDQELGKLPAKYRLPIILCDLEGKTRKEAARQLRLPEGTVAGRQARARALLAKRLTRRGLTLSTGLLATVLSEYASLACIPAPVVSATLRAAALMGTPAAAGPISAKVGALADTVIKGLFLAKFKIQGLVILLTLMVCCFGQYNSSSPAPGIAGNEESQKPSAKNDQEELQGIWHVVKGEIEGKPLKVGPLELWSIAGYRIDWQGRPRPTQMTFSLTTSNNPPEIDLEIKSGPYPTPIGKKMAGIYRFNETGFQICYQLYSDKPRPKSFETSPGDGRVLLALKRRPAGIWGDLHGKFILDGQPPARKKIAIPPGNAYFGQTIYDESLVVDKNGGLANVVLFIRDARLPVHPDYQKTSKNKATFSLKEGRYQPRVLPIRLGQTLVIQNEDSVGNNFFLNTRNDVPFNVLVPSQKKVEHQFQQPLDRPAVIGSMIYPWMAGFVFPRPNPYVAVSASDGTIRMKNLPVGEWEFQIWHEKTGFPDAPWKGGKFQTTIKPGSNDLGTIKLKILEKEPQKGEGQIQGVWKVEKADAVGKHLPKEISTDQTWVIKGDKILMRYEDGTEENWTFKLGLPRNIDLKRARDKVEAPGIYDLEKDTLRITFHLGGPRPTRLEWGEIRGARHFILERLQPRPGEGKPETFKGPTNKIQSLAFSPNGKTLATGGEDKLVRIWKAEK